MRTDDVGDHLWSRVVVGDHAGVVATTDELLDAGVAPEDFVDEVLPALLVRVGEAWHDGTWGVADEQRATALLEAGLARVEVRLQSGGSDRPALVLATPPGELHRLPGRLVAAGLRRLGWRVVVAHPADDATLARLLAVVEPEALLVSCIVVSPLAAVPRLVRVANRAGLPTLVGGAAFGVGGHRAPSLGAAGWAPGAAAADEVLRGWRLAEPAAPRSRPDVVAPDVVAAAEFASLGSAIADRVEEAVVDAFGSDGPRLLGGAGLGTGGPAPVRRALGVVRTAVLLDDPTVLTDFVDWCGGIRREGRAEPEVGRCFLDAVLDALPADGFERTRAVLVAAGASAI